MSQTISEMSMAEQYMTDDDPDLLRATKMTGSIRWLEIYRSYLLQDRLEKAALDDHDSIIDNWARAMGMTPATLATHLRWARMIKEEDLIGVFKEENIDPDEWTARIGTSHLKVVGRAKEQKSNQLLSSRKMAEWVRRAYHANLKVDELEDMLRDQDLLPPKRNLKTKPIEAGKLTGCTLLESIAQSIHGEGKDFELSLTRDAWDRPSKVHKLLRRVADLVEKLYPEMTFKPEEGK